MSYGARYGHHACPESNVKNGKSAASAPKRASWSGGWASLRDFEILHAVIETGRTTLAAARLGIGQPAVSRMLSQLESRVGRPLFIRDGAGLSPTADALAIYEEVVTIMAALNRIETFSSTGGAEGALRIAVPPTIAHCLLDRLTSRFLVAHPQVQVTLEVITTPQVMEFLVDGRVDVGIAELPDMEMPFGIRKIPYRRSQYVCAMRDNHALAGRDVITPADLHEMPFVALVKRNSARTMIDRHLAKSGSVPNIVVETSNAMSAINYVAEGNGVAIVNSFPLTLVKQPHVFFREFQPTIAGELSIYVGGGKRARSLSTFFAEFLQANQPEADKYSHPA
ncbi:LysR family transcriptional regulator [Rhizobium leguminosarum]|uniref:LysR family transcriptional regulator n=1 Tax=Rhizobium leguminosarum TaxID=384 RepID=A0ABD7PKA7_RHILE|nr:LysR family transcriptional regulator [Rhizobium leguminosarum]TAV66685.1 LysR family transcriptional regulator [Rhizobium leguminosarum]TAW25067.1 LysR family transcriptional regulator [Rhizobium leguminosarum]TAW38839.1 LysR family transcriptional regulator [Rhizobium leguminosarum]TAZ25175.1 LysR family transcriptional regulator [Rhizobium leguminosarum]